MMCYKAAMAAGYAKVPYGTEEGTTPRHGLAMPHGAFTKEAHCQAMRIVKKRVASKTE